MQLLLLLLLLLQSFVVAVVAPVIAPARRCHLRSNCINGSRGASKTSRGRAAVPGLPEAVHSLAHSRACGEVFGEAGTRLVDWETRGLVAFFDAVAVTRRHQAVAIWRHLSLSPRVPSLMYFRAHVHHVDTTLLPGCGDFRRKDAPTKTNSNCETDQQ